MFRGFLGFGEIEEYTVIINPTPDATITAGVLNLLPGGSLTLLPEQGFIAGGTTQSISVSTGKFAVTVSNPGNCSSLILFPQR